MKTNFTQQRVTAELGCMDGKDQEIHRDSNTPGLCLRVTSNGARTFVFEAKLHGRTIRTTIGSTGAWKLDAARTEAARLRVLVDGGKDPREVAAEDKAAHAARKVESARKTTTVLEAWTEYLEARRLHWSELHYGDHVVLAQKGGVEKIRGKGLTEPGPLWTFMDMRLSALTPKFVTDWIVAESKVRPARVRKSFDLLRIFAAWCADQPQYAGLIDPAAVATRLKRDHLPAAGVKDDVLQREQLPAFFSAVKKIHDPYMAGYLQCLLLIGPRREELAGLRWQDVDLTWDSIHLSDKVEASGRTVPMCKYVKSILLDLKRINETPPNVRQLREQFDGNIAAWKPSEFVFASKKSADGKLASPNAALHRACQVAGIPALTLHGLRRSFSTLSEWLELPTGVIAQIQGHKPSATAERHYKRRSLDLLRMHMGRFEEWIVKEAGIEFTPAADDQKASHLKVAS